MCSMRGDGPLGLPQMKTQCVRGRGCRGDESLESTSWWCECFFCAPTRHGTHTHTQHANLWFLEAHVHQIHGPVRCAAVPARAVCVTKGA